MDPQLQALMAQQGGAAPAAPATPAPSAPAPAPAGDPMAAFFPPNAEEDAMFGAVGEGAGSPMGMVTTSLDQMGDLLDKVKDAVASAATPEKKAAAQAMLKTFMANLKGNVEGALTDIAEKGAKKAAPAVDTAKKAASDGADTAKKAAKKGASTVSDWMK